MSADAAVIVFARAPLPGRAKTRLVPKLGAWGAARLQARLTERAVQTAIAARCGPVELHGTPRAAHPFFRRERRDGITSSSGPGAISATHAIALMRPAAQALRDPDRRRRARLRAADLRRALRLLRSGCDASLAPARMAATP
jgi:hypothetical protein